MEVPLLLQDAVLPAKPAQLILLGAGELPGGALAVVDLRLLDPAPQRGHGQIQIASDLADAAGLSNQADRLGLLLGGELPAGSLFA